MEPSLGVEIIHTVGKVLEGFFLARHTSLSPFLGLGVTEDEGNQPARAQGKVAVLGPPQDSSVPSAHPQEPAVWGWGEPVKHSCSLSGTKESRSQSPRPGTKEHKLMPAAWAEAAGSTVPSCWLWAVNGACRFQSPETQGKGKGGPPST
jgi:hypothetical protein